MVSVVQSSGSEGPEQDAKQAPRQIEFPLKVPVCAWCRPRELGGGLGAISHGICPRHFRQLLLDTQRVFSSAKLNATVTLVRDSYLPMQADLAPLFESAA